MNNYNIDQIIENVKRIVDNNQCAICDRTDGHRLRYYCGHTACDDCVVNSEGCQLCLTPPQNSSPRLDEQLTQRARNASVLLKACQDLFHTDVLNHKRLSEQLRIEKELFPKCIQAPVKYENKRKSKLFSYKNKENRDSTFFPGEGTHSPLKENITMENSVSYVQQWLNKNDKDFSRKPFQDLNVNSQLGDIITRKSNNKVQSRNKDNISVYKTNRKRSHFKTTEKSFSNLSVNKNNKHSSPLKKLKKGLLVPPEESIKNNKQKKYDYDESGIFMDHSDLIVIDDSQDTVNDKDKNAWLAVLEANQYAETEPTSVVNVNCSDANCLLSDNKQSLIKADNPQSKLNQTTNVPFYKKSSLNETCPYCNEVRVKDIGQSKEVIISVDNESFTTTIKIFNSVKNSSKINMNESVSVQTDINATMLVNDNIYGKHSEDVKFLNLNKKACREDKSSQKSDTQSEDLFADEGKHIEIGCKQHNVNCLVIEESDSDTDMDQSGPLPVKVDVHRSCDESEYGVLGEVVNIREHDTRYRRGPRGLTPTSTDSSEKENFNPNRIKNCVSKKKKYTRK